MKKFLLIAACFIVTSCGSTIDFGKINEPINNFRTVGGNIIWENIYEFSPSDSLNIIEWLKRNHIISKESNNMISGQTHKESLPYKKAGYGTMNMIILLQHPCEVFYTIDFKETKYRVIVNKILWYPAVNAIFGNVSTNSNLVMSLDEVAHKNNGYKSIFINQSSKQINDMLNVLFKIQPVEFSQDW